MDIAHEIADFMVEEGTQNTESGNYHFSFDEISERFSVSLPADEELLQDIEDAVWENHVNEVAELDIEDDFDFMFWLYFCKNADLEEV